MVENKTPWQKVFARFAMPQNQLAKGIKRHRSKVSRAIRDERGFINGSDQARLKEFAREVGIDLPDADLTPDAR